MTGIVLASAWRRRGAAAGTFITVALAVALLGSTVLMFTVPAATELAPLFGTSAAISGFIAIFVAASTIAFSIDQRQRELALLRAVGATPRQVRRMVTSETLALATVASLVGVALAPAVGTATVAYLRAVDWLGPGRETPTTAGLWWALGTSAVAGLIIARLAVIAGSRRAGRARALDALRTADAPARVMTVTRWLTAAVAIAGSVAMLLIVPKAPLGGAIAMSVFVTEVMVIAVVALAPLLVPLLVRVVLSVARALSGSAAELASAQIRTGVRRAASTAGPILASVAIFGSLIGNFGTLTASLVEADRAHLHASLLGSWTSDGARQDLLAHFDAGDVVQVDTFVGYLPEAPDPDAEPGDIEPDYEPDFMRVAHFDAAALGGVIELTEREGSLAAAGADAVVVSTEASREYGLHPGRTVTVELPSGATWTPEVAAVAEFPPFIAADAYVPTRSGLAGVDWHPAVALIGAGEPMDEVVLDGARAVTEERHLQDTTRDLERINLIALVLMTAASFLFAVIAIANTQAMGARQRRQDIGLLRRTGATPRQVLAVVASEVGATTVVGVGLGFGLAMVSQTAVLRLSEDLYGRGMLVLPWGVYGALAVGLTAVALVAAVSPTVRASYRVGSGTP